jgi:hypothetical protein
MNRLSKAVLADQDISTEKTVATVAAPATGSQEVIVRLLITGLPTGYQLQVTENYDGAVFVNDPIANDQPTQLLEVHVITTAGDDPIVINLLDLNGVATDVDWITEMFTADTTIGDISARLTVIERRLFAAMMRSYGVASKEDLIKISGLLA